MVSLTSDQRQQLRETVLTAVAATPPQTSVQRVLDRWELQTSNSFRRIGCHGDGDVLCATTQLRDNHPDLLAPKGVLEYIVAAQPRVVLALLDQLDAAEQQLDQLLAVDDRLSRVQDNISRVAAAMGRLVAAGPDDFRAAFDDLVELLKEMKR